jgi:hypothetical protein
VRAGRVSGRELGPESKQLSPVETVGRDAVTSIAPLPSLASYGAVINRVPAAVRVLFARLTLREYVRSKFARF